MAGMYDSVIRHKSEKKEGQLRLSLILTAIGIFAVVMFVSFVWFLGYRGRFTDFVGGLSSSTAYAHENDSLIANVDGKLYKVSEENMYGIYAYLSLNGSGRERKRPPKGDAITLDYGNGAVLKLWSLSAKEDSRKHYLFVQFTDPEGDIYSYISYNTTLETVVVRYLTYGNEEV